MVGVIRTICKIDIIISNIGRPKADPSSMQKCVERIGPPVFRKPFDLIAENKMVLLVFKLEEGKNELSAGL